MADTETTNRGNRASRALLLLCALALLAMPTQYAVRIPVPGLDAGAYFGLADLLVWAGLGLAVLSWILTRRPSPPALPWAGMLFVAAILASAIGAERKAPCLKEAVQQAEYFVAALLLFGLWADGRRRLLRLAFIGGAAMVVVWAASDYVDERLHPFFIAGSLGNRNVLGAYLAIAVPALFAYTLAPGPLWRRVPAAVLVVAGLVVNTSGGGLIAMAIGMLVVAGLHHRVTLAATLAALVLFLALAPDVPPRARRALLKTSIQPVHASDNDNGYIASARMRRWHAGLNLACDNPLNGVGAGSYQANIGAYYDGRSCKPDGVTDDLTIFDLNADEPDSHNLYLVHTAETGLIGLACLLLLLGGALRRGVLSLAGDRRNVDAMACLGAVVAFALVAVFANPLVRGVALPFAFLIALPPRKP